MTTRQYSRLILLPTLEERYEYLKLDGAVGFDTFGVDRWMNQRFYTSREWRQLRHHVIARDNGCDLGLEDHEIPFKITIHHMNPMTPDDLVSGNQAIMDPEFLISVSHQTHNAIHYGVLQQVSKPWEPRQPGDTKLW